MTITFDKIQEEVFKSYKSSITNDDVVDKLLDEINNKKSSYIKLTKSINRVSELLIKITWLNNLSDSDKLMIHGIIAIGKVCDNRCSKFLNVEKKAFLPKGLFKEDLKLLSDAIINHKEALQDLVEIIELREDDEFKALSKIIDEL